MLQALAQSVARDDERTHRSPPAVPRTGKQERTTGVSPGPCVALSCTVCRGIRPAGSQASAVSSRWNPFAGPPGESWGSRPAWSDAIAGARRDRARSGDGAGPRDCQDGAPYCCRPVVLETGGCGGTAESGAASCCCGAAPGAPPRLRGARRRGIRDRWLGRRIVKVRARAGQAVGGDDLDRVAQRGARALGW